MKKLAPRRTTTEPPPGVVLRPVVALDLDGTLFNWHWGFLDFAHVWLKGSMEFSPDGWFDYQGGPLHQHMGIDLKTFREVKLAYRQSGLKRDLRPFSGAHGVVAGARSAGAEVWVCTTRPYLRLDNIDPDTQELLRRNRMTVDGVIFGEDKYRDLVQLVGKERVVGVLDDLPEMVRQAQEEGLSAYLIQRSHNQEEWKDAGWHERMPRMPSLPHLPAAQEWLLAEIKDWKVQHDVW